MMVNLKCHLCGQPAVGIYNVTHKIFGNLVVKPEIMCAACAFTRHSHIAMWTDEDGETHYYRDIARVDLVHSITSDYDATVVPPAIGMKPNAICKETGLPVWYEEYKYLLRQAQPEKYVSGGWRPTFITDPLPPEEDEQ